MLFLETLTDHGHKMLKYILDSIKYILKILNKELRMNDNWMAVILILLNPIYPKTAYSNKYSRHAE